MKSESSNSIWVFQAGGRSPTIWATITALQGVHGQKPGAGAEAARGSVTLTGAPAWDAGMPCSNLTTVPEAHTGTVVTGRPGVNTLWGI